MLQLDGIHQQKEDKQCLLNKFSNWLSHSKLQTAQNLEKRILQMCLRISFYTYIIVNPYHFLKKMCRYTLLLSTVFLSFLRLSCDQLTVQLPIQLTVFNYVFS